MRILIAVALTVVVFLVYKVILNAILRNKVKKYRWYLSILDYVVFMTVWIAYYEYVSFAWDYADWEVYVSMNLIAIFTVIWSHFALDVTDRFMGFRRAVGNERSVKKAILFGMVFLFTLYHGYRQTIHLIYGTEVNELLSLINYSIVIEVTAFEQLMHQLLKITVK